MIRDKTVARSRECIHAIDHNYRTDNITGKPGGRAKREKLTLRRGSFKLWYDCSEPKVY